MKKVTQALLFVTIAMIAIIIYERFFVQSQFGPSSMLAVLLLGCFALALITTLVLYETRFHIITTRIWLATISVGLTFLLADLIIGAILIKPLSPELTPDKVRHHKLAPNTYSRFEQQDFSYIQRVNNLGLRGEDTTLAKPSNYFRIIMLGDSFTMGKGVEDNQTFSALLENSLNQQKTCESTFIEVLNGGVDSYAPILSYLQLSHDLVPLKPDVVLLNLDVSDLLQEGAYRKEAVYDANNVITGVPGSDRPVLLNQRIRRWIDQNLFCTRLLLFYTNKLMGHKDLTVLGVVSRANPAILEHTLANDDTNRDEQWNLLFKSISKIKKFSDERSISFALVVYPWGHQVNEKEWLPGRYNFMPEGATVSDHYLETIYRLSKESGIEVVNLFPAFRSYDHDKPLYFNHDMHWTTEGHKVVASELEKHIMDNYSTAWCE
jgi:hypothetical protein